MAMNTHNNIKSYIKRGISKHTLMKIHNNKGIIDFIKKEKVVTSSELAKQLDVSWNTAEKNLLELVIEGKIEKIKKLGVNLWILK